MRATAAPTVSTVNVSPVRKLPLPAPTPPSAWTWVLVVRTSRIVSLSIRRGPSPPPPPTPATVTVYDAPDPATDKDPDETVPASTTWKSSVSTPVTDSLNVTRNCTDPVLVTGVPR